MKLRVKIFVPLLLPVLLITFLFSTPSYALRNIQKLWPLLHSRQAAMNLRKTYPLTISDFRGDIEAISSVQYSEDRHLAEYGKYEDIYYTPNETPYYWQGNDYLFKVLGKIYNDPDITTWQQTDPGPSLLEIREVFNYWNALVMHSETFDCQERKGEGYASMDEVGNDDEARRLLAAARALENYSNDDWSPSAHSYVCLEINCWDSVQLTSCRHRFKFDLSNITEASCYAEEPVEVYCYPTYANCNWDEGNGFETQVLKIIEMPNVLLGTVCESDFFYALSYNLPSAGQMLQIWDTYTAGWSISGFNTPGAGRGKGGWGGEFVVIRLGGPDFPKTPSKRLHPKRVKGSE